MAEGTRRWREVRGQRALSESEVERYRRLMDTQQRLADCAASLGVDEQQIAAALLAADPDLTDGDTAEQRQLTALVSFLAALGATVELRALLPEGTLVVSGAGDLLRVEPSEASAGEQRPAPPGQ